MERERRRKRGEGGGERIRKGDKGDWRGHREWGWGMQTGRDGDGEKGGEQWKEKGERERERRGR